MPAAPVFVHPLTYAGVTVASKIEGLRQQMRDDKAAALIVCALDEVACMLGLTPVLNMMIHHIWLIA